jgi:hypothetical protein
VKENNPNEARISCHRCGNIRKRRITCPRINCPHTFCGRCSDKLKLEYGHDVFINGCPFCKDLCCCSNKTIHCLIKFHCKSVIFFSLLFTGFFNSVSSSFSLLLLASCFDVLPLLSVYIMIGFLGYRKCPATKINSRRDILSHPASIDGRFCENITNHLNNAIESSTIGIVASPSEEEKHPSSIVNGECKQRINALLQVCANFDETSPVNKDKETEEEEEGTKRPTKRQKVAPTVSNDSQSSRYPSIDLRKGVASNATPSSVSSSSDSHLPSPLASSSSSSHQQHHHHPPYFSYYPYSPHLPPYHHSLPHPSHFEGQQNNNPYLHHMMSPFPPPPHPMFTPYTAFHHHLLPPQATPSNQSDKEAGEKETNKVAVAGEETKEEKQEKQEKQQVPLFSFPYYYHHPSYHPHHHQYPAMSIPYPFHPHHMSPHPFPHASPSYSSSDTNEYVSKQEAPSGSDSVDNTTADTSHHSLSASRHPYYSMFPYYLPPFSSHLAYFPSPVHPSSSSSVASSDTTISTTSVSPVKASLSSLTLQMPASTFVSEGSPTIIKEESKEVTITAIAADEDDEKMDPVNVVNQSINEEIRKKEIISSFQEISGINLLAAVSTQYLLQESTSAISSMKDIIANVVTPKMQE